MADKTNVIVGAAQLYVGPAYVESDSATHAPAPVGPVTGPPAVPAEPYTETLDGETDWRNVGYTNDGLEISFEPEFADVEVDQELDAVRVHKTSQRVTLTTTLVEATLENLLVVWGMPDDVLATSGTGDAKVDTFTIQGGFLGQAPLERQLIAVGNGSEQTGTHGGVYAERTYHAKRVLSTDTSAHSMRRSEAVMFPVSFRLLPTDESGSPYGVIRDRVRSW